MNIAQRMQTLQKKKVASQEELANALNISRQAISTKYKKAYIKII